MKPIHIDRLLVLADALERLVPAAGFRFEDIMSGSSDGLRAVYGTTKRPECGSAACAIGWCPIIFPTVFEYSNPYTIDVAGHLHYGNVENVTLAGKEVDSFLAVQKAFGISLDEAEYLFETNAYGIPAYTVTKEQVARRIREFVERKIADGVAVKPNSGPLFDLRHPHSDVCHLQNA